MRPGSGGWQFSLRPADRLWEGLWIDPEDWVADLLPEVAGRAGNSLQQPESNPLAGRVQTVGDFVKFITLQPKIDSWSWEFGEGGTKWMRSRKTRSAVSLALVRD
jgi:hypothetical protein